MQKSIVAKVAKVEKTNNYIEVTFCHQIDLVDNLGDIYSPVLRFVGNDQEIIDNLKLGSVCTIILIDEN